MDTDVLMVVLGEREWTQRAMHLACAVARDLHEPVVMVDMVRANHPALLGEAAGLINQTAAERQLLQECAATAEDYGVEFQLRVVCYADFVTGLASAAEQIHASLIFAPPPAGPFGFWNRLVLWRMEHAAHRAICTLESANGQPVIMFAAAPHGLQLDRAAVPLVHHA